MQMNHEEQDKLWELLGKARQPKASAFFAANVVRAARASADSAEQKPGLLVWLRTKWYLPATAGACAALIAIFAHQKSVAPQPSSDPLEGIALAAAAAPEIPESLDSLLALDNNSIWLAGDPSSLY